MKNGLDDGNVCARRRGKYTNRICEICTAAKTSESCVSSMIIIFLFSHFFHFVVVVVHFIFFFSFFSSSVRVIRTRARDSIVAVSHHIKKERAPVEKSLGTGDNNKSRYRALLISSSVRGRRRRCRRHIIQRRSHYFFLACCRCHSSCSLIVLGVCIRHITLLRSMAMALSALWQNTDLFVVVIKFFFSRGARAVCAVCVRRVLYGEAAIADSIINIKSRLSSSFFSVFFFSLLRCVLFAATLVCFGINQRMPKIESTSVFFAARRYGAKNVKKTRISFPSSSSSSSFFFWFVLLISNYHVANRALRGLGLISHTLVCLPF